MIELQSFFDPEESKKIGAILEAADIPFKISSQSRPGHLKYTGWDVDQGRSVVFVPNGKYRAARRILEKEFSKATLPDDHFLCEINDDELIDMLSEESEWPPFDIAHAKIIARERGIPFDDLLEVKRDRFDEITAGMPASREMMRKGWIVLPVLGISGFVIAWEVLTNKETHPEFGTYHTYDEASRKEARKMMRAGMSIIMLYCFAMCVANFVANSKPVGDFIIKHFIKL